ncbi:MAG: RNA polymerase sigma factor, partial [Acidimicrobiia bacterium]
MEEAAITIPNELEREFRVHHGMVFATAYRITGNAGDAEDVLQTVFLRLLRRGSNADPLENPESYLRRAAINAALDVIRSRQADQTVPMPQDSSALLPVALAD